MLNVMRRLMIVVAALCMIAGCGSGSSDSRDIHDSEEIILDSLEFSVPAEIGTKISLEGSTTYVDFDLSVPFSNDLIAVPRQFHQLPSIHGLSFEGPDPISSARFCTLYINSGDEDPSKVRATVDCGWSSSP